jgi:lipopolysaccharide heptosyltransferase II
LGKHIPYGAFQYQTQTYKTKMKIKKKPAVLILINVRWWNATAFYAINIARILHKNGHSVFVGCDPRYPAYKKAVAYNLNTVPLAFYGYNPIKLFKSFIHMLRLVKKEQIEILNPHRTEDHFFALLAKLTTGISLVVTRGDQRKIKKGLLSRLKYSHSDAVVTTCRSIIDQNRHIFSSMPSKVSVIHGSVDEEHFRLPPSGKLKPCKLEIDTNRLTIGLVGRISPIKGQETFIQAAAIVLSRYKNIRFVTLGPEVDTKINQLRSKTVELGIEQNFVFMSKINMVADFIDACDICVTASVASETISRVVLEYLYVGKPVIGTRINAISEIILPGINGELFDPYDHDGLASAILKLARNPDLRRLYAKSSRRLYQERYSEQIFYKKYLKALLMCRQTTSAPVTHLTESDKLKERQSNLKFLIIRFSSFGDIILTTPVLTAVKAKYPSAAIDFLVMEKYADAIYGNPDIDRLILFEKAKYRGIAGILRFARGLRKYKYDQVIDLHAKLRSIILSYGIGVPVFRYRKRRLFKAVGVKLRLMRYQVDDTTVNNYFGALKHLDISTTCQNLRFDYSPKDTAKISGHTNFIVLAPGAARVTKRWPMEYFAQLGRLLKEKIIIVGGPEDMDSGEEICRQIGSGCHNMAGKLSLKQSGALIAQAKFVVCNDSVPFHMARGVGTKAYVLFGPTDPGMFSYDQKAILIYAALSCSPCSLHGDRKCPLGHFNCMRQLTPEKVIQIISSNLFNDGSDTGTDQYNNI